MAAPYNNPIVQFAWCLFLSKNLSGDPSARKRDNGVDFLTARTRLMPKINALAAGFAGASDYDDMVQEGLIALYECTVSFDPEREIPFDAFALTCVRRRMISAARKNANLLHMDIGNLEDSSALVSGAPSPDEVAVSREGYETLKALLINNLSSYELKVLSLHLEGLSYRQIARRVQKTPKSVDNALVRVKSKLSRRLKASGE